MLLPVDMYLKTLAWFPSSIFAKVVLLHSMSEQVTDISEQSADISAYTILSIRKIKKSCIEEAFIQI